MSFPNTKSSESTPERRYRLEETVEALASMKAGVLRLTATRR
jgi:hypothetical protein